MVRLRHARWCNLKLLLIFCVVYGHWIEPYIHHSALLMAQYRVLYLFHMPLFVFLSGLFLNRAEACLSQMKRLFPVYVVCQGIGTAALAIGGQKADVFTPVWVLWYLLSYCAWAMLGYLWFRLHRENWKWLILWGSVLLGGLAGFVPWVGRAWGASRTIVFFPYFFAGLLCRAETDWQRYRPYGLASLLTAAALIALTGSRIPVEFLYQAEPYGTQSHGFALRLLCCLIGGLLCFALVTLIPDRRYPFTRAGADTLPAYLIHAPIVFVLREYPAPWYVSAVLSAALLYLIWRGSQWSGKLYGIVPGKRRGRSVGISGDL